MLKGSLTDRYIEELKGILKKDTIEVSLISALIVYPSDVSFKRLKRKLVLESTFDKKNYLDLETEFVSGGKRSLALLKYEEHVMYKHFSSESSSSLGGTVYKDYDLEEFDLEGIEKSELQKESNLTIFWTEWIKAIQNERHFSNAKSTLWSYVVLRRREESKDPIICSVYLIFSGEVDKQKHIINKISQDFLYLHVTEHFFNDIKRQATRAAISQVMARNMSHNHGSHVLSRMIHEDQIENILSEHEGVRYILSKKVGYWKYKWDISGSDIDEFNKNEGKEYPIGFDVSRANEIANRIQYLSLYPLNRSVTASQKLAYFNSYAKTRMDFLADIATGTPTMESSKMFYGELIGGFDKNRILLDRISGVDNFKYRIELHDCRHCDQANGNCFLDNCRKDISSNNDLAVAIPNDIVGQHAFYVILENIIRNTAKHSGVGSSVQEFITFHIEVREPMEESLKHYYEIHVYDSFDKQSGLEELVRNQNESINQNLLDSENKLRLGAWGMIEMETSAAYLRKVPVEHIDDDDYELDIDDLQGTKYFKKEGNGDYNAVNILKAFIKTTKHNTRHLAYRFFMLKPKEILAVVDDVGIAKIKETKPDIDLGKFSSELIRHGIWLKYKGREELEIEEFDSETIYEHEILLDLTEDKITSKPGMSPDRVVREDLLGDLIRISDYNHFKETVWGNYCIEGNLKDYKIENFKQTQSGFMYKFTEGSKNVVFDHHAVDWASLHKTFPNDIRYLDVSTGLNSLSENLSKAANQIFDKDDNEIKHRQDKILYIKLLDSIRTKCVVIDERLQEAACLLKYKPEGKNTEIAFYQLYQTTGVLIPPKKGKNSFDFSVLYYPSNCIEMLEKALVALKSDDIKFLVIHLGVLEKILSSQNKRKANPREEREEIGKLITQLKSFCGGSSAIKPIIISGRGTPSNVPEDISFVNYSAVSQYLVDNRSKLLLSELFYSARNIPQS